MLSSAPTLVVNRFSAAIRRWRGWLGQRWTMLLSASQSPSDSQSGAETAAAHPLGAISGEPEFDAFFAQFEQPLFGYVQRIVANQEIAIDIVQETFVRAWVHFADLRGYERPQAWLYRVATHLALNQRRDQHTITFTDMHPPDASAAGTTVEERWIWKVRRWRATRSIRSCNLCQSANARHCSCARSMALLSPRSPRR